MTKFSIKGCVERFAGKYGWYYVELDEGMSKYFRSILADLWPALIKAEFTIGKTTWQSSIMPIKDGPLFIALPARIRKAEEIDEGQIVTIQFGLKI